MARLSKPPLDRRGFVLSCSLGDEECRSGLSFGRERAVLVHGDVHQWNASQAEGGFKLVDPDGLLAEAEYDLGILMREDPLELLDGDPDNVPDGSLPRTRLDATAIWEWGVVERVSTGLLGTGSTCTRRTPNARRRRPDRPTASCHRTIVTTLKAPPIRTVFTSVWMTDTASAESGLLDPPPHPVRRDADRYRSATAVLRRSGALFGVDRSGYGSTVAQTPLAAAQRRGLVVSPPVQEASHCRGVGTRGEVAGGEVGGSL